MNVKDIKRILQSYNLESTYGPSIYYDNKDYGLCLDIKDSYFGFLTRYFTFNNTSELEEFLKTLLWYQNNKTKWPITLTLDNYEVSNPQILYKYNTENLTYNDMINLKDTVLEVKSETNLYNEREIVLSNIEKLTNYLIDLKQKKIAIRKEKNDLKIKETELKYALLSALNTYYGNNKTVTQGPNSLDIIKTDNSKDLLLDNLKNIKEKDISEMEKYLDSLINIIKKEETEDKYLINIYSNNVYKYNINILNKQIDFVKRKIESEKNFNIKGSKKHNIDAELKSFLTSESPISVKDFINNTKAKLENKYNKITNNKEAYHIISGDNITVNLKDNVYDYDNAYEHLNNDFNNLDSKSKAYIILYNSFYRDICDKLKNNLNTSPTELINDLDIKDSYNTIESIAHNEINSHYLANYFKYINFNSINTYLDSLIDITKTVINIKFQTINTIKVFCLEQTTKNIFSINPIYNKRNKTYIIDIPAKTSLLYIPNKIIVDEDTNELSIINSKDVYLNANVMDTSDSIIVNKYQKNNHLDKENNIYITSSLKLLDTYNFNIGCLEGE